MGIQTVGSLNSLLNGQNYSDWAKKAELKMGQQIKFDGLSNLAPDKHMSRKSFSDMLTDSVNRVNTMQKQADVSIQKLASGESKNIHETLLAVEQAEIAFKTMNQVRSKVIDAYKEIMRMQV